MNVLITGAAGGLGRAFAVECAKRGFGLFLTDINAAGLESIRDGLIRRYGVKAMVMPCDITDSGALDALFARAREADFRIDMLINVAGGDREGAFMLRDADSATRVVRLNICAPLYVTHKALEARNPDLPFYIIFVSSLASMYPMPLKAAYAASKRFLLDFSLALRHELLPENVYVTTLCPAGLATTDHAMSGIAAQGFLGSATSNNLEKVTRKTINMNLRGGFLYIPGMLNKALYFIGSLIPRGLVAGLIYRRWSKAQKRWLCPEQRRGTVQSN